MKLRNAIGGIITGLLLLAGGISMSQAAPVPISGLVAYYPFNGNATDASGNGHNGTPQNGVALTSDRFGNPNSAYLFDGINDNIFIGGGLISPNALTIAAWFRQTSVPTFNKWRDLVAGDCGAAYLTLDYYANRPAFGGQCDAPFGMTDAAPVTDTSWHHVVATYGGGQVKVYVDGILAAASNRSGNFNAGLALYIGAYSAGGSEAFAGSIDEVYIYNRALTASEVAAIFTAQSVPPVANAGADQNVNEMASVSLDGTASHDSNTPLRPITYAWTQLSGPTVALANANTASPTFTAPAVPAAGAALVFQLAVNNGGTTPVTDTVTVNIVNVNSPPTANAGADQTVGENTVVTLNASGSDPDGDALTMHWSQVAGFGPTVVLTGADTTSPSFTAPDVTFAQGTAHVKFQLVVNDGNLNSGPSTVIVHIQNVNDAPVANAGLNQSVNELEAVTLNGSASSDPDGNALTFSWTQILGTPTVILAGAHSVSPSFTAPELNIGGANDGTTLTFELTVNDGRVNSAKSTVNVRVNNVNHAPLADAGIDQSVPENTAVTLNGANSADTDGDMLTFAWLQTGGPSVTLDNAAVAAPNFTTPDTGPAGATLTFQLTVDDGYSVVTSDEIVMNVTYVNRSPTAGAGVPQTVNEGSTVNLAGTASDPDGNDCRIAWTQVSGPHVTLNNASTLAPSFAAPLVTLSEADVVLRLSVGDGYGGNTSSDVSVHLANINHTPTAQAPANMTVPEGSPVSLIGQGNDTDTEEQSQLTYVWQQTAPATGPLFMGATLDFTTPLVTAGGNPDATVILTFKLTVTDPNGATDSQSVGVTVANIEHAPTAVTGGNQTVNEASSVTLNATASSDPDSDALTYGWVQTSGPAVILDEANTAFPFFTAPFVSAAGASLKFQLIVSDGFGGNNSASMSVTVQNINDPPVVANARPSVAALWPPDHSMVKGSILGIVDPNNNATIRITSVTQDEPTNGLGDGDTAIDAIINADGTVLLRAERSGNGNGRVYHVHFTASDFEGSAPGVVTVGVPHSKKTVAPIDGGELFDSTH